MSDADRKELLEPLLAKGWTLVNGRDAINKEFLFKDFNEVNELKKITHLEVVQKLSI